MKKFFEIGLSLLGFGAFVACTSDREPDGGFIENPENVKIELAASEKLAVENANSFAFSFWKSFCDNETSRSVNQAISPVSLQMVLSMMANGGDDNVLEDVLSFYMPEGATLDGLNEFNGSLLDQIPLLTRKVQINLTNSIWCDENLDFAESFSDVTGQYYDALGYKYKKNTSSARDAINTWCLENTKGMIKDYLKSDPREDIMLINASYFNGEWQLPFDGSLTEMSSFYCESGKVTQVEMMTNPKYCFRGQDNEYYTSVRLPYYGGIYHMDIFMPKDGVDFDQVVKMASNSDSGLDLVKLTIPKFDVTAEYNVLGALEAMGYGSFAKAVLPDIAEAVSTKQQFSLYHPNIKQKTRIVVDERGTQAGSVTSMQISTGSRVPQMIDLTLDHPFFFTIKERSTGLVLFMGKIGEVGE